MSFWNRRQSVSVRPEPRPETVADLYTRLLEAPELFPLTSTLIYTIRTHPEKYLAIACFKRLLCDDEAIDYRYPTREPNKKSRRGHRLNSLGY